MAAIARVLKSLSDEDAKDCSELERYSVQLFVISNGV